MTVQLTGTFAIPPSLLLSANQLTVHSSFIIQIINEDVKQD